MRRSCGPLPDGPARRAWARSSAGEHIVDIDGVTGSIPVAPTILPVATARLVAKSSAWTSLAIAPANLLARARRGNSDTRRAERAALASSWKSGRGLLSFDHENGGFLRI